MTKLIAETAWHHEGDTAFLNILIEHLFTTKVDFIKLHLLLNIDEYMHSSHPAYKTIKSWLIKKKEWEKIINKIISGEKELMLLYNDIESVEFGSVFKPKLVEIHSVCLNDCNLLNALKINLSHETNVVLGVGGSTIDEIKNAINILDFENIVLMFGFQNYPTEYADINFNKMKKIMQMFPGFKFGYADHTAWNHKNNLDITLMGASMGVDYIEKHVTTKFGIERTDWNSAISFEMLNLLKEKLDILNECKGNGRLELNKGEKEYSKYGIMKKAPVAKSNITLNTCLKKEDIEFLRTNENSDISQIEIFEFINRKIKKSLKKGQVIRKSYFY